MTRRPAVTGSGSGSARIEGTPGGSRTELVVSSDWSALVDELARSLREEGAGRGIFVHQTVVLPNDSRHLGRWLRDALATRLGVLAQVRFLSERAVLEEWAAANTPGTSASPLSRLLAMVQLLDEVVRGTWREAAIYAPVRAYLAMGPRLPTSPRPGASAPSEPFGAHALAFAVEIMRTLAVLERYRAEELGAGSADIPDWLRALWREHHRTLGTSALGTRLAGARARMEPAARDDRAIGRVHWFGLSSLDPVSLNALVGAGGTDHGVTAYAWAPHAPPATADLLVAGWTAAFRRPIGALQERGVAVRWLPPLPASPSKVASSATALSTLQSRFRSTTGAAGRDADPSRGTGHEVGADDDSLSLHGCHGPLRQVEVLHDALLALFERHPTLSPRDVRISTPSIETYAPLIEAVFASGEAAHGRRWPLSLSATNAGRGEPDQRAPRGVVDRVLGLVGGRFAVADMRGLLEEAAVRLHFGLSAEEIDTLDDWLNTAVVRWGVDGPHRSRFTQLPSEPWSDEAPLCAHDETTWSFGLDRLALSITSPSETDPFLGRTPSEDWEGGAARIGATLLRFVMSLQHHEAIWTTSTTLAGWLARANDLLDSLVGRTNVDPPTPSRGGAGLDDDSERLEAEEARANERAAIDALRRAHRRAFTGGADRPEAPPAQPSATFDEATLEASGFRVLWQKSLPSTESGSGRWRARLSGIAVVPLTREAALPAKVVAFVGLDEDTFPAHDPPLSLASWGAPRPLDPSRRDEDRAAFLQALLSAEDHVVLTAGLRHPKTHAPRPPATPVAELFEILDDSLAAPEAAPPGSPAQRAWLHEHPLQAFDPLAFGSATRRPRSHDPRALALAEALQKHQRETPGQARPPRLGWFDAPTARRSRRLPDYPQTDIELSDICAFFRDPLAALLRTRLGVWTDRELAGPPPRREPLSLDGLTRWQLQEEYFRRCLRVLPALCDRATGDGRAALQRIDEALSATGRLPVGGPGAAELRTFQARFEVLATAAGAELEAFRTAPATRLDGRGVVGRQPADRREVRVLGSLAGLTEHGLLAVGLDDPDRPSRLLTTFLSLLCALEANPNLPPHARLLGVDKSGAAKAIRLRAPIDPEARRVLWGRYLELYFAGLTAPLPFAPRTSLAFAETARKAADQAGIEHFAELAPDALQSGKKAAERAWFPNESPFAGGRAEGETEAARAVYGDGSIFDPATDEILSAAFVSVAEDVWSPILRGKTVEVFVASADGQGTWQTQTP
jgi:exonuclease V gamma subunit